MTNRPIRRHFWATSILFFFSVLAATGTVRAQWVEFLDQTGLRLSAAAGLGTDDLEEKDYAWGDVDKDGDIDLVVVRKEPFTSPGKRANVFFRNESGVLVDRTVEFASASDVGGDQGFLTATNDRDVQLADLNNDTWLDIVTATTISDGDPKHIGHPRVYMNLGEDGGTGNWLGFRYEDARIPTMTSYTLQTGFNPRFCSVAVGDITGDGFLDLWFGDYDSSGAGGFGQPTGADFNDRLLINDGTGNFTDVTRTRLLDEIDIPGSTNQRFEVSAFGAAANIADMNGDGFEDIIKQTSLSEPLYVGIAYNDPDNEGFFDNYEVVNQQAPYFVSVGDLNKDGKLDLVITDDGADRYMINQGNDAQGRADFLSFTFSFDAASDSEFGSNSVIADLNNDTWNDVLIADVDVDISGCSNRLHIYRNLGGTPGSNITLQEQTSGSGCESSAGNPASCIVASIPSNKLKGVHDMAVFDLNDDGWLDMVVGRCETTEVYINQPPVGLSFSYPLGLPAFVTPSTPHVFQMQVNEIDGAVHDPGTGKMFVSVNGAAFSEVSLVDLGSGLYQATLPGSACTSSIRYYFTADDDGGSTAVDPAGAPTASYTAIAALGTQLTFKDTFESDVSAWTVVNDPALSSGGWEQAQPIGTIDGGGNDAAPGEDAEAQIDHILAFVTQNGVVGGGAADADVDGGPTELISPAFDLSGTDGTVSYSQWYYSSGDDSMTVWVTPDGSSWTLVDTVLSTKNEWQAASFRVGDFVTPSATVQVRFRVDDSPNNSVVEAGLDLFRVDEFVCTPCATDPQCDDLDFCNGVESCTGGLCVEGPEPCSGQQCDETLDTCVACTLDVHCDDGDFCNGSEICSGNACTAGIDPCPGTFCDEGTDTCADCLIDADCDDGSFCNGAETCISGTCNSAPDPCPAVCDEILDSCVGNVIPQPKMGAPLNGLTTNQLQRFEAGRVAFNQIFTAPMGLGPTFNQNSCGACHNNPVGGSGSISVTRFGFNDDKGGGFDSLDSLGGSLLQAEAVTPACEEIVPPVANVTTLRVTNSTLGFGLVEAVPDAAIQANETNPPTGVSGRAHIVDVLESPGTQKVGRFGWKSQVATVLSFSGDAALNEMGITNRLVGTENAPNGDTVLLAQCDTVADPEDGPDGQGLHFIDRVTDFQRYLAPPPQTPRSGMSGEALFNNIGCGGCHVNAFTTADDAGLEDSIRDKILKPYSDFLVHDMGQSADFIEQGDAQARELRTAPLWGLRVRDPLWHDGRVAGGTFLTRILSVVQEHRATGSEARNAAISFGLLSTTERDQVVAFLDSLGRAEFDSDGDGDVDSIDLASFQACQAGPGGYSPDDPCAVHDSDQDGDVDDDDFALFVLAAEGNAGRVPDGKDLAGVQLILGKGAGDQIDMSWGDSCDPGDTDYEIYEGPIGDWTAHGQVVCSTSGATADTIDPNVSVDTFYLVVPNNGFREGSYGSDSDGGPRPAALAACFPQSIGECN